MQKPNMLSKEFHSLGLSEVYLCSKSLHSSQVDKIYLSTLLSSKRF